MKAVKTIKLISFLFLATLVISGCTNNFDKGEKSFNKGLYGNASFFYSKVSKDDENYSSARERMNQIRSIMNAQYDELLLKDSILQYKINYVTTELDSMSSMMNFQIETKEKLEIKLEEELRNLQILESERKFKNDLETELENIDICYGREFIYELSQCKEEIIEFGNWAKYIKDAENYNNPEITKLSKSLKSKLVKLQKKRFPILREHFSNIFRKKLWENDMKVGTEYSDKRNIIFIGSTFVKNKNKRDFHDLMEESYYLLRFKKAKYKWSEYDDNYTTYTMETPDDGDIIVIEEMKKYLSYLK